MRAMVLEAIGAPLQARNVDDPIAGPGEVLIRVTACGVCRTDLHVIDGELPDVRTPIIPGHEIIGRVAALGSGVNDLVIGDRVGAPWLGGTCGRCDYCLRERENLCDAPSFNGYTRPGGYAGFVSVDAQFVLPLPAEGDDAADAPLMCAGLIGWRALKRAGDGERIGLYGFGAAAHIITQIIAWQGRKAYAFTRPGDAEGQHFARGLGAYWAGDSQTAPPHALDAAIIFAPDGALVPMALKALAKGGRVVCAGIHMSDIPSFPYALLWGEREIVSVANLTRVDAEEFLPLAREARVATQITRYPLAEANAALADLRHGRLKGAAVLIP